MPIKSNCCDSPIAAKCMKCEKMCEVVEYQTSTWSAHYGFLYITVGSFIWCGYLAPVEWRWFVFLTFTVFMTVVCILNVQNKKKYGTN